MTTETETRGMGLAGAPPAATVLMEAGDVA